MRKYSGDWRPDIAVQCPRKTQGCTWKGDFRLIPYHENECVYGDSVLLKELCRRMDQWEGVMKVKDKEISLLKYNMGELRESLHQKQEEIDSLVVEKNALEERLRSTKEKSKEMQQRVDQKVEGLATSRKKDNTHHKQSLNEVKENLMQKTEQIHDLDKSTNNLLESVGDMDIRMKESLSQLSLKVDNLTLKNELVEKKFTQTESKMSGYKEKLETEFELLKKEVSETKDTVKKAMGKLNKQFEELQLSTKEECRITAKDVNKMKVELSETRSYFIAAIKENEDKVHYLSAQFSSTEKSMKDNYSTLNSRVKNEIEDRIESMKKIKDDVEAGARHMDALQLNVANVENVLFCDYSDGTSGVILKWKLQNYSYHQKMGMRVCSPVFYTQLQGYRFKLFLEWSGSQKDKLDLCLMLCAGVNYDKPLERFKMAHTLEMIDNKGNVMSYAIPLRQIETYTGKCFTIQPGKSEAEYGFGCAPFLTMPELGNYIVNDMLSINCRITPL